MAGVRLAARVHPYNLIVTNVPGPPVPVYFLGSKMETFYPQVPLFESQGLGVAIMTYMGRMHVGLVGDWDLLPDLHVFADAIDESFEELRAAAEPS